MILSRWPHSHTNVTNRRVISIFLIISGGFSIRREAFRPGWCASPVARFRTLGILMTFISIDLKLQTDNLRNLSIGAGIRRENSGRILLSKTGKPCPGKKPWPDSSIRREDLDPQHGRPGPFPRGMRTIPYRGSVGTKPQPLPSLRQKLFRTTIIGVSPAAV